jgi:Tfp pilus assembly protein PilO
MDFFSKKTIKYKSVATMPLWLLYAATLGFCLIIFLGWYFFIFNSLMSNHAYYADQLPKLEETISHLIRKKNENAQASQKVHELKTNHIQSIEHVPLFDARVSSIFDLINSAQLRLVSFAPDKKIDKKWYTKKMVNYIIKGSYVNLISFFEQLKQAGLCIQCKQLTINKIEDGLLQMTALFDFFEFKGS